MKPDPTVLIIDDEKASRRLVRAVLQPKGYRVVEAESPADGLNKAAGARADIIILEIALSNRQGLSVLRSLREWNLLPVLVLSQCADDEAKVAALDAGASDYLTKPFSAAEILARLRVLLRPVPNLPEGPLLMQGSLVVNLVTHQTVIDGQSLKLTAREQVLFYVLAHYAGRVVTCSHLLRSIWGIHSDEKLHDLRVLVFHLRRKLGPYGGESLVRTEGSLGYSLVLAAQQQRDQQTLEA